MKKEFKFPTILGIILLLGGLVFGVYLVGRKTIFGSKASGACSPDNVQVTNITDRSADISFVTASNCLSTVEVNNNIISDLKGQLSASSNPNSRLHYFQVKHLSPTTEYDFSILSGGTGYTKNSYLFKTGSAPSSSTPTSNLAWGRVLSTDGKNPASAIVYLNIPGSQPLSSIVTTNGNWSVSLASSFNDTKTDWYTTPASAVDEEIIVISEDGITTQVTNTSARNNPVPDIIVGKNSLEAPENLPTNPVGQITELSPVPAAKTVDITNPKNGEIISTSKPDFFGSAPINSTVIIEVHSETPINGQATSNNAGEWHWTPPEGLAPGEHTITVKVQNAASGLWESVTRNFTVLATDSASGPQYEASGSAVTSTPTPTLEPTIAPTDTPIPTTRVARPSTTVAPPVSGNLAPTILIIIISSIFVLLSIRMI